MRILVVASASLLTWIAACGGGGSDGGDSLTSPDAAAVDASAAADSSTDGTTPVDGASDVPLAGFGAISGMCGVLNDPELMMGTAPVYVTDTMTFATAYRDPDDRPLLTPGGQTLAATPNAGGSSGLSEVFAFEELDRCERATLLKTETQIVYSTPGKITDELVEIDGRKIGEIDGRKIGVSVTRAVHFPFGQPYTPDEARALITRKLTDIQASTANVSATDRWDKQVLAVLAYDTQHAGVIADVWASLDAATKADTIVVVTITDGADDFIYTNQ